MAKHNTLGHEGEDAAVDYLVAKGYRLHERNWRHGHVDVDIIMEDRGEMVFVEVKTRTSDDYGAPEEAVDNTKMRRLINAADAYVKLHAIDLDVRFDIVTVIGCKQQFSIEHIKEAFEP